VENYKTYEILFIQLRVDVSRFLSWVINYALSRQTMANSLHKMRLHGSMVAVFIILDSIYVLMNTMSRFPAVRLIEGIGQYNN